MEASKYLILAGAVVAGLTLGGCGSEGGEASSTTSTISGAVSSDTRSVALRDSSEPARALAAVPAGGSYSLDVEGMTPPFSLRADRAQGAQYTIVTRSGNADVNELTTAVVEAALQGGTIAADRDDDEGEDGDREDSWSRDRWRDAAPRMGDVLRSLRTVLKPLFDLYGVGRIGGDDEDGDPSGMRALLRDVSFTVRDRTLAVTNRATGAVIYSAPVSDLASGTFHPEAMPPGPGGNPPPPPAACTYSYGAWGACQSNGTQTRAVTAATPAGCAGTPMTSQSCTYVPPPPAACTYTYGAWGACQSNNTQTRTVTASTPAGCTGTPMTSQSCTYVPPPPAACTYTYSAWGACQSNNTQTRTVTASTPAGCTGTPATSQSCTYTPPAPDGAALYTANCSRCHGALASSDVRARTAAQITSAGMTRGLPAAQIEAIADALK